MPELQKYGDISNYISSKGVSKTLCNKKSSEYIDLNLYFFNLLIEYNEIAQKDFDKENYYYFIIEEDFSKFEKQLYTEPETNKESSKAQDDSLYI